MDGTGALFEDFISSYAGECLIIPLPMAGEQDYMSLATALADKLPKEEFILLAESFSGGIVPYLLEHASDRIRGVIFVASFLSPPGRVLLFLGRMLPIAKLATLSLARCIHKELFLGRNATDELVRKFFQVIRSVPARILKQRLKEMAKMKLPGKRISIPAAYIQAMDDKLVSANKWPEFLEVFANIKRYQIKGPHFILQANPAGAAELVSETVSFLTSDA